MSRGHKAKERVPAPGLDLVITRARAVRREGARWSLETRDIRKIGGKIEGEGRKKGENERGRSRGLGTMSQQINIYTSRIERLKRKRVDRQVWMQCDKRILSIKQSNCSNF